MIDDTSEGGKRRRTSTETLLSRIASLPPRDRAIVDLVLRTGASQREIASLLKCTTEELSRRIRAIAKQLHDPRVSRRKATRRRKRVAPSPVPVPIVFVNHWFKADDGRPAAAQITDHGTVYVCSLASDGLQAEAIRRAFAVTQPGARRIDFPESDACEPGRPWDDVK